MNKRNTLQLFGLDAHLYQLAVLQVHDAVVGKLPVPVLVEFHTAGHPVCVLGRHQHPGEGSVVGTIRDAVPAPAVSRQCQMDSTAMSAKKPLSSRPCFEGFLWAGTFDSHSFTDEVAEGQGGRGVPFTSKWRRLG